MSLSSAPHCCGQTMRELNDPDECAPGMPAFKCDRCGNQQAELADGVNFLPLASGKHSRDPRLAGIRKKSQRWEVRIAGGRKELWIYVGLFSTLEEAIHARDEARGKIVPPEERCRSAAAIFGDPTLQGIYFLCGKWLAELGRTYLGRFAELADAIKARNKALRQQRRAA